MIKPLTSFRFLAALMVFFYHVGIWKVYQTGYMGVSFFFILSGFILCLNYREKLGEIDLNQIKKFYLARFAKIYPTHVLTFLLAIPFFFFIPIKHSVILYFLQALTNLFLLHSYIPVGNFSFNGPSWSISVEFFFYAVFPFMIYAVLKKNRGVRKKIFSVCILWGIMIIIAILFSWFNMASINTWLFYIFPLTRAFDFFVGVVLGLVFLEVKETYVKISKTIFSTLEIFSIILLVTIVIVSPYVTQNLRYGLIFTPILSVVIFVFAFEKGGISNFLSHKLFVYLGEISFSFYMIHNLVLSYSYWSLFRLKIMPITITGCFLVTVILSSLLYHFYEEPLRKKIRYFRTTPNTRLQSTVLKGG